MKLSVSLRHDNDRFTARNLTGAAKHFNRIFTGSRRNHLTLPSRLLRSERNKRPMLRVSASRQVEAPRDASPFLRHLNACHTFAPFKCAFYDKDCCFFVSGVAFHNTIQESVLFDYVIAKAQVYPRKHRA